MSPPRDFVERDDAELLAAWDLQDAAAAADAADREVRAAPLDDRELQPPWAAPARDGVLSERFEVRCGAQLTPTPPGAGAGGASS